MTTKNLFAESSLACVVPLFGVAGQALQGVEQLTRLNLQTVKTVAAEFQRGPARVDHDAGPVQAADRRAAGRAQKATAPARCRRSSAARSPRSRRRKQIAEFRPAGWAPSTAC